METQTVESASVNDSSRTGEGGSAFNQSTAGDDTDLFFTFLLGHEIYGIAVNSVKEVINYGNVFKTPGVPEYIKGVINLRGEVVPVIDLSSRFYRAKSVVTDQTCIVVVEIRDDKDLINIGVMIDAVKAVTGISKENLESAPEIGSRIPHNYISAIGKLDNQFIILLNINNALDLQELSNYDSSVKTRKAAGGNA